MKYRIFSKRHNFYTNELCLLSDDWTTISEYIVNDKGNVVQFIGNVPDGYFEWIWKHNLVDQDDFIIQMYSGMDDKNFIPIYEGDIIKIRWYSGNVDKPEWHEDEGEVFFENGIFNIKHGMWFATNDANLDDESFEIVGNTLIKN